MDVRKGIRVRSRNRAGSPRRCVVDAMGRNSSGNVRESRVGWGGKFPFIFNYRTGNFFFSRLDGLCARLLCRYFYQHGFCTVECVQREVCIVRAVSTMSARLISTESRGRSVVSWGSDVGRFVSRWKGGLSWSCRVSKRSIERYVGSSDNFGGQGSWAPVKASEAW